MSRRSSSRAKKWTGRFTPIIRTRYRGRLKTGRMRGDVLSARWREMKVAVVHRLTGLRRRRTAAKARATLSLTKLLVLCLWFSASPQVFAADLYPLTVVSYPDRPPKFPLWLAQDAGLFEKHGLKIDIKTAKSGEDLVERIGHAEAQIYAAQGNWIVAGICAGTDLVFFANTGYSVLKLLSHPSITRPSELKGK